MVAHLLRAERCLQARCVVQRELYGVCCRTDAAIVTTGLWHKPTWHYVDLQLAVVVDFAAKQLQ